MLKTPNIWNDGGKLKKADIFREGDEWFMYLEYEYEDDKGRHSVTLPKVEFPWSLRRIPQITICCHADSYHLDKGCIEISGELSIREGNVTDPLTNKIIKAFYTDIVVEPKIHDLTLEEIEKKLGYKVRIVADAKGE